MNILKKILKGIVFAIGFLINAVVWIGMAIYLKSKGKTHE